MTPTQTLAVSALVSAVVAAVVARATVRRWITHAVGEPAPNGAQTALRCSMCGAPVASVSEGIEHVDDVHGLRLDAADAERVLTSHADV